MLAVSFACGGKVVVDSMVAATGAGGGSSSVASNTSSATSSATASSGIGGASTTSGSSSASASVGSGGADCSAFGFNGIGAGCGPEGTMCRVPWACCEEMAVCKGGVWVAAGATCGEPCEPCDNGLSCMAGTLCVQDELLQGPTFQCFVNPCFEAADCSCAASVCTTNFLMCASVFGNDVLCNCPTCG